MRLKIASRKSDLARWQSVQVARALESLAERPSIEFNFKASMGDLDLTTPLSEVPTKGVFTEDFLVDLQNGACDLVVHSWKDLPTEERATTQIACTLPRADVRDVLLVPEAAWLKAVVTGRLVVLTSSPRRKYNLSNCLQALLPLGSAGSELSIEFADVRGNVPTRLQKMLSQNHALILAKAGLDRLVAAEREGFLGEGQPIRSALQACRFMVLPISLNPAAPAQGALAIEALRSNSNLNGMCNKLNDEKTYQCVNAEREILRQYGGGCHQKIGVTILSRPYGRVVSLRGLTDQGETLSRWEIESSVEWRRATFLADVFPLSARDNQWFDREAIAFNADLAAKPALMVARAEALPSGFKPGPRQVVWTSGVQTWRRLAKMGIWVNGSYDGLGEQEGAGLETLLGGEPRWTKLSHARGNGAPEDLVATYQLKPRARHPDLSGKTHFFWLSSTAFERARQIFPQAVNNGFNAAGPGSTFEHICRQSGLKRPPRAFIGLEQFLAATVP